MFPSLIIAYSEVNIHFFFYEEDKNRYENILREIFTNTRYLLWEN